MNMLTRHWDGRIECPMHNQTNTETLFSPSEKKKKYFVYVLNGLYAIKWTGLSTTSTLIKLQRDYLDIQ